MAQLCISTAVLSPCSDAKPHVGKTDKHPGGHLGLVQTPTRRMFDELIFKNNKFLFKEDNMMRYTLTTKNVKMKNIY